MTVGLVQRLMGGVMLRLLSLAVRLLWLRHQQSSQTAEKDATFGLMLDEATSLTMTSMMNGPTIAAMKSATWIIAALIKPLPAGVWPRLLLQVSSLRWSLQQA